MLESKLSANGYGLRSTVAFKLPSMFSLFLTFVLVVAEQPFRGIRQVVFIPALGDQVELMSGAI
jgi:hypothetical protein